MRSFNHMISEKTYNHSTDNGEIKKIHTYSELGNVNLTYIYHFLKLYFCSKNLYQTNISIL